MGDFIDREASKEAFGQIDVDMLPEGWKGDRFCKGFGRKVVNEVIDSVPSANVEPVKRWIPVSEGLPNDFEDVLCWYEYFRFGSYNRMFRKCGVGYQVNGHWGGEVSNGRNAKVLAWMPLPEPPKDGRRH